MEINAKERIGFGLFGMGLGVSLSYLLIKIFPNSPYLDILHGLGIFLAIIGLILSYSFLKKPWK